jgi:putative transposon-encoded protein
MLKKQSRRSDAQRPTRGRKSRVAALIILALVCVISTSLLAQVDSQRRGKRASGEVSVMSLSGPPAKEYIYAGSKLVATVEPTAVNGNDAQFVSMSYLEPCVSIQGSGASWLPIGPGSFGLADQAYSVRVTMKNTGSTPWLPSSYYLGSQNPPNNVTWGAGNRISLPSSVPPTGVPLNGTVTFEFSVRRPVAGGNLQWQMVQGPVSTGVFFGERTTNVVIPGGAWLCSGAPPNLATFVSQSVPSLMFAGQSYPVSVTMNNGGTTTWTTAANYKLGSQLPQDNVYFGTNRVAVPSSVSPGANAIFSFTAIAPADTGIYNFQWMMVQDGGAGFFGYLSPSIGITVTSKAGLGYLDYNVDTKTDAAVWRPSTKQWLIDTNLNGAVDFTYTFGASGDLPVPSDYNGDGKADLATIKPSSMTWYFDFDRNGTADQTVTFGTSGDIPTPHDYNGDKQADIARFRPSTGQWFIDMDRNGSAEMTISFGQSGDIPVPADYDGDGKADLAAFRPSTAQWLIDTDRDGVADLTVTLGQNGDIPIAGDYNGDGRADFATFRPSTGQWRIDTDRNGTADMTITMGQSGDVPAPGEYNGDGVTDLGVFRPSTNKWSIDTNRDGTVEHTLNLGASGDIPLRQNGWILKAMGILPQ